MSSLSEMDADVIGEMATQLDLQQKGKDNWKDLVAELGVPRSTFLLLGTDNKPTKELFEYLITHYPNLTMKELRHKFRQLTRTDVVEVMEHSSSGCLAPLLVIPVLHSLLLVLVVPFPFFFILPSSCSFSSFHFYSIPPFPCSSPPFPISSFPPLPHFIFTPPPPCSPPLHLSLLLLLPLLFLVS